MGKIELTDHEIVGVMTYAEICCPANEVLTAFGSVLSAANVVCKIDPMASLSWKLNAGIYNFVVIMADGRKWKQTIRFVDGIAWMTYNVRDEFSTQPMKAAFLLRQRLIEISAKYGVSKIQLTRL